MAKTLSARTNQFVPVEIVWGDAHGGDSGWELLDTLDHSAVEIVSVGLLLWHSTEGITIVLSTVQDRGHISAHLFVPQTCIRSVRVLK